MSVDSTLTVTSPLWSLEFSLLPGVKNQPLFLLTDDAGRTIRAEADDPAIRIVLDTRWPDAPPSRKSEYSFELQAPEGASHIRLMWLNAVIRLYADGRLTDEEWPLGLPLQGKCRLKQESGVTGLTIRPLDAAPDVESAPINGPAQFYRPPYYNAFVGDCMPFSHDGCYRLYHLFDRRHHASKAGLGAHQWAHISSRDLKEWTLHPIAVGIDEQWEGSICTGSMIESEGLIYAFYAARMSDNTPARLTWAVSEDGISFKKSGKCFSLSEPYEPVSARDPKVFMGEDGLFHMLVTTSLISETDRPGCLAHLTSPNLTEWTQQAPLYVLTEPDQPECSDYFEWKGRYYLVFSTGLGGHYRISDHPFGPWSAPEDDFLVSRRIAVPKTAQWNGRLLVSGWIAPDKVWGGCAVTFELVQRGDGTLAVRSIEELEDGLTRLSFPPVRSERKERLLASTEGSFRLKAALSLSPDACGELVFRFDEDASYRLRFDAAENRVSFLRADGVQAESVRSALSDAPLSLDLTLYENALLLLLPDGQLFMPHVLSHKGGCALSFVCERGDAELTAHR